MVYSTIILEKKGKVAKITLNRPDVLNAINTLLRKELAEVLEEIAQDERIDVIILTGAGRAFCAGVDLKEIGKSTTPLPTFPGIWDRIRLLKKPIIAAVNGFAITGGLELALSCDIIIASENSKFADTHARVGVFPRGGVTQILPRLVGIKKAKELSFACNFLNAQEALHFGLVNKVVPLEELHLAAEKLASDIINNNQMVVRKMKEVIDQGEGMTLEDAIRLEQLENYRYRSAARASEVTEEIEGILEKGREQAKGITG